MVINYIIYFWNHFHQKQKNVTGLMKITILISTFEQMMKNILFKLYNPSIKMNETLQNHIYTNKKNEFAAVSLFIASSWLWNRLHRVIIQIPASEVLRPPFSLFRVKKFILFQQRRSIFLNRLRIVTRAAQKLREHWKAFLLEWLLAALASKYLLYSDFFFKFQILSSQRECEKKI